MDKVYNHKEVEEKIYKDWEEKGYFKPEVNPDGLPYTIILPPPNANGALHFGHAMFTVEDILIRYHRMKGFAALWLPGIDHAGIETQFVFEKNLQKEGKSRFEFDRDTLYQKIWDYVEENRGGIENQLRRLGFSLDWSREKYTLDPDIVKLVYKTFKRMYEDKLIYRDYRLVNYCTKDGTSFSDIEVIYEERKDPLYYIKYGPLVLATTRPETKFGDTAVAVNPKDKRYEKYVGKELEIETVLGKAKIKVVADESVDMDFGTGVVKITPAHDFNDFETGKRHSLPMRQVIGYDGKMNHYAGKFEGLYVKQARKSIVEEMQKKGLIEKIDENYIHRIGLCYKCKTVIEPLPLEQWFIKVRPLADKAMEVVKKGNIKIIPKTFENHYMRWMENLRDWNISRQIVWGIRIPAWFCGVAKKSQIKHMGFADHVVSQIFEGKTKTYRLNHKNFQIGEKIAFENSKTNIIFGYGIIEAVEKKKIGDINLQDVEHGATYSSRSELIEAFRQYYPPEQKISENTESFIYAYKFIPLEKEDIKEGCGQIIISENKPAKCPACGQVSTLEQDPDTFDTWFSSGQWPFVTLMSNSKSKIKNQKSKIKNEEISDYDRFYPTSVMETAYDILRPWVTRMVMLGVYMTGEVPFNHVLFHGIVNDPYGKKMSKSKGNVVNPLEVVGQYGADAVRFALIYGNATGNDQALSYSKLDASRKFTNKLWNMGRFIEMKKNDVILKSEGLKDLKTMSKTDEILRFAQNDNTLNEKDSEIISKVQKLIKDVNRYLDNYQFNLAAELLYEFTWHEFADKYIEDVKNRIDEDSFIILNSLFIILLKMLHPFMPYVTEEIYQRLGSEGSIMISDWPEA